MKKSIAIVFAVCAIVSVALAASFTAPTNYQHLGPADIEYGWNVISDSAQKTADKLMYNYSNAKDSLNGTDTVTLLSKYPLSAAAYYAFQIQDSSGAADSCRLEYQTVSYQGSAGAWTVGDTLAGVANNKMFTVAIPSTMAYKPAYISVRAVKWIATLVTKIKRFEVLKFPIGK